MPAFIGPPRNLTTAQRNALAAGSRPPGTEIFNTDNNRIEYNAGSDATPNWLTQTPAQYGTSFPTTGLFNGYRYTFFWTPPTGGTIGQDFIYRTDLDATYPWHAVGEKWAFILANASLSYNDPAENDWAASSYNVPRAGQYFIRATGQTDNNTNANAPQPWTALYISGSFAADSYGRGGLQQTQPDSVIEYLTGGIAQGTTIKLRVRDGGSDGTGTYIGTWRSWDFMYSIRKCA